MKKRILIINENEICKIALADCFFLRLKGLMGKDESKIKEMGGLLIRPCAQIHTFFMKAPIDVVYVGKKGKVIKTDIEVKPWKCCKYIKGAHYVLEFPKGFISENNIQTDDIVEVKKYE
jgi:hypothetical protein